MTDKPASKSAEPENPPDGPESNPPPAAGSAHSAWTARVTANPPAATRPTRSRRKKILVPVVLAVIGLGLLLAGFGLYPRRPEPPAPVSAFVSIAGVGHYVDSHIALIYYTVDQVRPDVTRLTITLQMGPRVPHGAQAFISANQLGGATLMRCSPYCNVEAPSPIVLPYFGSDGTATASFYVKARSFGLAFNGLTAAAAFPEIYFHGTQQSILYISYQIPSANFSSYDWSPYPASDLGRSVATWNENVTPGNSLNYGDTPGRVASGINHTAEAHDSTLTLLAGVLFGLGGGALVAAVQEALRD